VRLRDAFRRPRSTAAVASLAALALLAGLTVGVPGLAQGATPPPNPTNGQLSAAAQHKAAVADEVGKLTAQSATMQSQIQQLQAGQELAEQKQAYALSKLQDAKDSAAAAKAAVTAASKRLTSAQTSLREYAQASFMGGDVGGTTGSLLTAEDPNALLQTSALQGYESDHQISAVDQMQSATIGKSNADASARKAVIAQTTAANAATKATKAAEAAVLNARAQEQQLQASIAANQTELAAAQAELATLNHQRAAYNAYVLEQQRIAAAKALAKKRAAEAARKARLAAEARAAAAAAHNHSSGGSGGGSSSGGGGGTVSTGPALGGSWTAARGQAAVAKARQYLGYMYAWAGGNRAGPTYGVCAGDGAFNDCHIIGFDCSGLALYAWGNYIHLDHYAATQYSQAGSYHPSSSNLMPGDLVFWSSNGSQSGIHHVAIYIGGGNVIQAPESGEVIQITPLDQVDWGYYGATRPLT
jgi:cell wall-associated NlpC family hydrolase